MTAGFQAAGRGGVANQRAAKNAVVRACSHHVTALDENATNSRRALWCCSLDDAAHSKNGLPNSQFLRLGFQDVQGRLGSDALGFQRLESLLAFGGVQGVARPIHVVDCVRNLRAQNRP